MTAREFDDCTPREVQWRLNGLSKERSRQLRNTAQLAAWVLSMFSKEPIKSSDLVKLPDDDKVEKFDWARWLKGAGQ